MQNTSSPPRLAEKFLIWFLKEELAEEVAGDLEEKFHQTLEKQSLFKARLNYWFQVLNYLRPFALKRNIFAHINPFFMFRHNFTLAYRNFLRDKSTFLINLTGLSTGLACFLLIFLWVQDELSFDKFHKNDKQLFQVMQLLNKNEHDILTWESTPHPLADALLEEMPEVEKVSRISGANRPGIISNGESRFKAKERYIEPNFLELFSFEIKEGDKKSILQDKNSVLISDEMALKLFQTDEDLIGKTIEWERNWEAISGEYVISGIFKKPPANSTMQFDLLFSYEKYFDLKTNLKEWRNSDPATFLLLNKDTDIEQFNKKIKNTIKQHNDRSKSTLFVRPFSERYLYAKYENGVQAGGRITYVRLFSIIAIFILLIACINFMNLSTAKATRRMKEVGVKKTIGASRGSLITQYLTEAILVTFMAMFIAIALVNLLLPQFNQITNKALGLNLSPTFIFGSVVVLFITGIISGSYPALYLSGFQPIAILKGKINQSVGEVWARKGLVVFQFVLSILLIVSVLVVYQQIQFIQSKNLGFNKDNVVMFNVEGEIKDNLVTFIEEVKKMTGVVNASYMHGDMTGSHGTTTSLRWEGDQQEVNPIRFGELMVGQDFLETLDIELLEGRNFNEDFGTEGGRYIFNEAGIKALGMENPVGKTVKRRQNTYTIVGVVKDFHFESLYEEVKPCFMLLSRYGRSIVVKIKAGQEKETLAKLESFYGKYNPGLPFDYKFLDEDYAELYAAENRVSVLSRYFAGMAILISCLGLFGLAAFTAQRRVKEIGIRKILGASQFGIVRLLSADFTKMVLVAILIALPLSYWLAQSWLDGFAFRIDLKWWFFIGAASLALLIAWLTVGFQTFKAARVNPVECLKIE